MVDVLYGFVAQVPCSEKLMDLKALERQIRSLDNNAALVRALEHAKGEFQLNDWCMALLCDPRYRDTELTQNERQQAMTTLRAHLENLFQDNNNPNIWNNGMAREVMLYRTREGAWSRREITGLENSGFSIYEAKVAIKYIRMDSDINSMTYKLATGIIDILTIDDSNAEIERTFNAWSIRSKNCLNVNTDVEDAMAFVWNNVKLRERAYKYEKILQSHGL